MPDKDKILSVDSKKPESGIVKRAGDIIQNNGVVIFPAQCLYGVAVNALSKQAVKKVFHLKNRPFNKPILTLISHKSQLSDLVEAIPLSARILMDAFWPGNLTIVFKAKKNIPDILTAKTGKIGVRIPAHPVAKALVGYLKTPITGTSANLSGESGCSKINQLDTSIMNLADLVLNAGELKGGSGSSIVDVTSSKIKILRQGEVSTDKINEILDKYQVFP